MEQIISVLYLINGAIILIAYIPQLQKLRRMKEKPVNFSTASWSLWTYSSVIAFGYATIVIKDTALMLISGLNLICVALVLIFVLYKHKKY